MSIWCWRREIIVIKIIGERDKWIINKEKKPPKTSYSLQRLIPFNAPHHMGRWRESPLGHLHPHSRHVVRERGGGVPQHGQEGGLPSSLQTHHHQLHPVVGLAVSELGPEVGQEPFGGATSDARQEVVRDVGEGEAVKSQLPAVVQSAQTQRQSLQIWVTGWGELCFFL